jgi:hypothetical protein
MQLKVAFWGSTYPKYELYCPHWIGVKAGLTELGVDYKFLCCRSNFNYVDETVEFKPDLLIVGLADPLRDPATLYNIKVRLPNIKIVFWYGDLRTERTNRLFGNFNGKLDAMFVSNDGQRQFWQENLRIKNIHFLPLACEVMEKPIYNPKFAFKTVFIGSKTFSVDFDKRAKMVNDFERCGVKRIDSKDHKMRLKIYEKMPEIYSSSKISLDISHYTEIQGYTSVRYWEIPAMWGFALTKRFPGCEEFYPESMRAYFDTFEEAMEKIRYYLAHEEERLKMVELSHEHAKNHTHAKRFEEMFKILELKY